MKLTDNMQAHEKVAKWVRERSDATLAIWTMMTFLIIVGGIGVVLNPCPANAGEVDLSWQPPTTNEDGTPLEDLAGFTVYYYGSAGGWDSPIGNVDVGPATQATLTVPSIGIVYFVVTAYDTSGNESGPSNEVAADFLSPNLPTALTIDGVRE